jgi:hypothetical protein
MSTITFMNNPIIGDSTCSKSIFDILLSVNPSQHFQGLAVKSVDYVGNELILQMIEPKTGALIGTLVYLVYYEGDQVPTDVSNKGYEVLINWSIRFYFCGLIIENLVDKLKALIAKQRKLYKDEEHASEYGEGKSVGVNMALDELEEILGTKTLCSNCRSEVTESELKNYGTCFNCEIDSFERGDRD